MERSDFSLKKHKKIQMNKTKLHCIYIFIFTLGALFLQMADAQNLQMNKCGIDNESLLNECEAAYFNEIMAEHRGKFDFEGKQIAFAEGNWGANLSSKKRYFEVHGKPRYEQNNSVSNQLIILTESEKALLPQYDAILVSWSKLHVQKKSRAKLIQRIQKDKKQDVKGKV